MVLLCFKEHNKEARKKSKKRICPLFAKDTVQWRQHKKPHQREAVLKMSGWSCSIFIHTSLLIGQDMWEQDTRHF